jgi:hypothetical protein
VDASTSQSDSDAGHVYALAQLWLRPKASRWPRSGDASSRDQGTRSHGRCYVLMMPPSETMLEQQRRLLASIERIEGLVRRGHFRESRGLVEDFESDLSSVIDAPIMMHIQSRLALLHDRVRSLEATASEASAAAIRRGRLGEAVPAPDLNELAVLSAHTTQIWWRCSQNPQHQPWKLTKAQKTRRRVCPTCLTEAGLDPDAWHPTVAQGGGGWLDAHNHAMLWPMSGF